MKHFTFHPDLKIIAENVSGPELMAIKFNILKFQQYFPKRTSPIETIKWEDELQKFNISLHEIDRIYLFKNVHSHDEVLCEFICRVRSTIYVQIMIKRRSFNEIKGKIYVSQNPKIFVNIVDKKLKNCVIEEKEEERKNKRLKKEEPKIVLMTLQYLCYKTLYRYKINYENHLPQIVSNAIAEDDYNNNHIFGPWVNMDQPWITCSCH